MFYSLLFILVSSCLIPVPVYPMHQIAQLPVLNIHQIRFHNKRPVRGCPMSPYATFLSQDQQETLHELITEARSQGADEIVVREHVNKFLREIMNPQKYSEFQEANAQFEKHTRGKRHVAEKQIPRKVFDLIDKYSGANYKDSYLKFYENFATKKIRQLN
uniref:DUF148 domain-containing protein n=1 Tax=Heterorhabditis bacteriophora TaxID=37862 RepID=A0A1I7XHN7_HETBA